MVNKIQNAVRLMSGIEKTDFPTGLAAHPGSFQSNSQWHDGIPCGLSVSEIVCWSTFSALSCLLPLTEVVHHGSTAFKESSEVLVCGARNGVRTREDRFYFKGITWKALKRFSSYNE